MNSVSKNHWLAHNHLGQLTVKNDDPTSVVVASTAPFLRSEAPAWWVAFDLVDQFDKELKQCDAAFRRVQEIMLGCLPEKASRVQETRWNSPGTFELRVGSPRIRMCNVSDAAALVSRLGGEQLYGSTTPIERLKIALRELIQNAADAITARRLIGESNFRGHIRIRLLKRKSRDATSYKWTTTVLACHPKHCPKIYWILARASGQVTERQMNFPACRRRSTHLSAGTELDSSPFSWRVSG